MDFKIDIPEYDEKKGFVFDWDYNFEIEVKVIDNAVQITANKAGLLSLARHLISLSQDHYGTGYDIHLDSYNSLEDGSNELILQKG
jgi:hypothetical protein